MPIRAFTTIDDKALRTRELIAIRTARQETYDSIRDAVCKLKRLVAEEHIAMQGSVDEIEYKLFHMDRKKAMDYVGLFCLCAWLIGKRTNADVKYGREKLYWVIKYIEDCE